MDRFVCKSKFVSGSRLGKATGAVIEQLEGRRLLSAVNVLDYRYDAASSGVNSNETQLTPANVKVGSFGKLSTTPLDSAVYAEPLVESAVTIANGVNTMTGEARVHNVVFVATENDTVYAVDTGSGAILWKRSFLNTANSGGNINNTLGATSLTSISDADVGLPANNELWGITGTPVIDGTNNLLYVVVRTKEAIGGVYHFVQRLHALKLADGTDAATPFLIGDTSGKYVNNTPIYVYGTGDGSTTDPYNNTGKQVVQFNAQRELQRTALNLVNNQLYVAWASNGDNGPYHGFVASWNVANIKTTGFVLSGVLCTSPNDGEAGIWQGGGALAFDPGTSNFYCLTGNGTGGAPTLGSDGLPTDANYNEAVIKVVPDTTTGPTHQNANGWGMKVSDFFIPYNVAAMDGADSDFGSGAPLILPAAAGIAGHPNLLIAGGKDGRIFVLDRDDLGGYHTTYDAAINAVTNSSGNKTAPNVIAGTLSTPTYFNGKLYLTAGYLGNSKAFTLSSTGALVASSTTSQSSFGGLPGGPTVSSDGSINGIVWLMDLRTQAIHAYSAASLGTELWNSTQAAGSADALGAAVKFAQPTVANGEVFVGTQNSLVIYGLTPPSSSVPNAPVLKTAALSSSSINLTWTDSTAAPNTATGYIIKKSTDDKTFTQATTAPAGATSISIGGLTASTTYYFEIFGVNSIGTSPASNISSAETSDSGGGTTGVSPNAPTGLGASPASATSVYLTWTANSTNQTGYHLDRATDAGFTQNLITEILPASGSSYTDTATGLAPGQTFYYRLRAFNSAGDSGNSNSTPAVIPYAPNTPTLQSVTNVLTNEIDMTWQDNAGHTADGYLIIRAVNHGTFSSVATLPPTSRPAPSMYSWVDTSVTPGNYYEYHIEAYNVSGHIDFAGVNATSITNAPAGVKIAANAGSIALTWTAVTGAVSYNIYRGTKAGGEAATALATGLTSPTFTDSSVTAGTVYYYTVKAVNLNSTYTPPLPSLSAASAEIHATAIAATKGIFANNITVGAPPATGSSSQANGVYTLTNEGVDINNTSDQFEYAYNNVTGDTTIIARVTSITYTHSWAKAGVMIRNGVAANAAFATVVITPAGHLALETRTAAGKTATLIQTKSTVLPPQWLKLVRSGNTFTGSYSADGVNWTQIGAQSVVMPAAVSAGLAMTSTNPTHTGTATFTNVSITSTPPPAPAIAVEAIEVTAPAQSDGTSKTSTVASTVLGLQ